MSNKLINFALAKSIYCEKKNYLDTFSPFILKLLSDKGSHLTLVEIDDCLKKNYDLKIPINTLKSILSLLFERKLIELDKTKKSYLSLISKTGQQYVDATIESEKNISRKLQEFWQSFNAFTSEVYGTDYKEQNLEELAISFINDNLIHLIYYALDNGDVPFKSEKSSFANHFSHFISEIEGNNNALFCIFQEILKGSILWNEIACKNEGETEADLKNITIYLDTNYLVSLFELDHPNAIKAAKQLYNLLRRQKSIILKVFTISLEEIKRLLNDYKKSRNYYYDIPVNDVYYFLKANNYDDAKIDILIANLAKKCSDYGITTEELSTIELNKANEYEKEFYESLYRRNIEYLSKEKISRKEQSIHLSTLHDSSIALHIQKRRGAWVQSFEDSKIIFLTSSPRLDSFIKKRAVKKNAFPETILDLTLTNILWLKNPEGDIGCSIQHLISIHAKNMFVDHSMWKRFISIVNELKNADKISEEEYAFLISNNQITKNFLTTSEPTNINRKNVLNILDKILASNIVNKEELNKAYKHIKLKDQQIQSLTKNSSILQSRLDKAEGDLINEKKYSGQMRDELNSLKNDFNKSEERERKRKFLDEGMKNEIGRIKTELCKILKYSACFLILNSIIYYLSAVYIPKWLSYSITAISLLVLAILVNKASNKEYYACYQLMFKNRQLREKIFNRLSKEYEDPSLSRK